MKPRIIATVIGAVSLLSVFTSCTKWREVEKDGYVEVIQNGGKTLGYSQSSGIALITDKGFAFKDMNRNGELDVYEDWRLPVDDRAKDLASKMSVEQIAGLMLYSSHQSIPSSGSGFGGGATYNGKQYNESGAVASDITDQQKIFLTEDNVRHVLVTSVESPRIAAEWNNKVQSLVEGTGLGIPANNSSDPRNGASVDAEYNAGNGGKISMWPGSLGMAATFDPSLVKRFGQIASLEYRALGISTALSPQIDIATEPRWSRTSGTFGEDPKISTDMARAYADGFQTTYDGNIVEGKWGNQSVNAMIKHWPGGGSGEGGRDAHYGYGKYAVYPGDNLSQHIIPFVEGAMRLEDGTEMAAAVMPYYTISYGVDPEGNNVGNSYSSYIITDLLRDKYGYDGVVCTDWMITADEEAVEAFTGKCWGMETKTVAERHFQVIMAGVDQFGGNNDKVPVLEAYQMGVDEFGEEAMRQRFETSAVRLLRNIFRTGLFENPYVDPSESEKIVGNSEFMKEGYDAQVKSIVMLKNKDNTLPVTKQAKVYIEKRPGSQTTANRPDLNNEYAVNTETLKTYFTVVDSPEEADFGIVFIQSPSSGSGYDVNETKKGGNGYMPISLQYNDYKATNARAVSIAGGDIYEDFTNRSYKNKTVTTSNKSDMDAVISMKGKMGDKPVVVMVSMSKQMVFSEIEGYADAILVGFGIQNQAFLDVLSGTYEPSGLLPFQMPKNMKTVEEQYEDVPFDMDCYVDSEENVYDFGFGMNWSGVINDERTAMYAK